METDFDEKAENGRAKELLDLLPEAQRGIVAELSAIAYAIGKRDGRNEVASGLLFHD